MTRRLPALLSVLSFAGAAAAAPIPAFPGAEGYGAFSTGGRGGDVYIVANLNRSGPGSFAEGIATVPPQGRTIVFAVSGYIPISKLKLAAGRVTIAGQTAPGDGVGLKGSSFWISGPDVVVRHLRFRHGRRGNGGDCLNTDGGATNLVIDHCDTLFSADENFSMFRGTPPTMTVQWTVNAWGLQTHSAGGLWTIDRATAHHMLWAHNHTRNPKLIRPVHFEWINNVTFGWDIGFNLAGADVAGTYRADLRGSTFIHGSRAGSAVFGGGKAPDGSIPYEVFIDDCALDGDGDGAFNVTASNRAIVSGEFIRWRAAPTPRSGGVPAAVEPRRLAYKKVISQAGPLRMDIDPSRPLRDEVAAMLFDDVARQRRRIIGSEAELGLAGDGMGALRPAAAPADADRDGMPDAYEAALGWNPGAQDHNVPLASTNGAIAGPTFLPPGTPAGYTRLEEYLHFCAIPHGTIPGPATVDLRKFTSGFTASPRFAVGNIVGGRVEQGGPGGASVRFAPAPGFTGRAQFDFRVTDSEGDAWIQTCALVVLGAVGRPPGR
jgi:hypothetical protein